MHARKESYYPVQEVQASIESHLVLVATLKQIEEW